MFVIIMFVYVPACVCIHAMRVCSIAAKYIRSNPPPKTHDELAFGQACMGVVRKKHIGQKNVDILLI